MACPAMRLPVQASLSEGSVLINEFFPFYLNHGSERKRSLRKSFRRRRVSPAPGVKTAGFNCHRVPSASFLQEIQWYDRFVSFQPLTVMLGKHPAAVLNEVRRETDDSASSESPPTRP